MAELILSSGGRELARLSLSKSETTIGRDQKCDLRIAHQAVSPLHAVVARDGRGFFIRDEGSKWGIVDRGQRVKLKRLRDGDFVTVCKKFRLMLSAPGEDHPEEVGCDVTGLEGLEDDGVLSSLDVPKGGAPEQARAEYMANLMRAAEALEQVQARERGAAPEAPADKPAKQAAVAAPAPAEVDPGNPLTARELRERREAADAAAASQGLTSHQLLMIGLGCLILSCFSVVAAAFF